MTNLERKIKELNDEGYRVSMDQQYGYTWIAWLFDNKRIVGYTMIPCLDMESALDAAIGAVKSGLVKYAN